MDNVILEVLIQDACSWALCTDRWTNGRAFNIEADLMEIVFVIKDGFAPSVFLAYLRSSGLMVWGDAVIFSRCFHVLTELAPSFFGEG